MKRLVIGIFLLGVISLYSSDEMEEVGYFKQKDCTVLMNERYVAREFSKNGGTYYEAFDVIQKSLQPTSEKDAKSLFLLLKKIHEFQLAECIKKARKSISAKGQ